ncbi:MAG: hypothetical protein CV089_04225 [Nitrospira sp. WS110]|nr:hypothetical protein [Nitrospira sp. WS110]
MHLLNLEKEKNVRKVHYLCVLGIIFFLGQGLGSLAYGKTVEAGDSSSSWSGTGEYIELGNGDQVVNGLVKGVLISRHKDGGKMVVHSSKLTCPVRVKLNRGKDSQSIDGLCTMIAHQGKDIGYGTWKCTGTLQECVGDFTFTGGSGGFTGMSGTTPFQTNIVFELQEGRNGQAIGYAIWPNLTYTLP